MLLDGKKLLITGVLTDDSIAFAVAKVAQEQGAEILLTNVGKGVRLTERVAKKLPSQADVMQMDVNNPDDIAAVSAAVTDRWGRLDGALHAIAFAPQDALGGNFLTANDEKSTRIARYVPARPPRSDFDGDGFVTGLDFDLYVQAFEAGAASADFDGDGFVTGLDFDQYVLAYEAGC